MKFDELSNQVIGCAIEVHRELGPELLESTYEQCIAYELSPLGIPFKLQVELPVDYKRAGWSVAIESICLSITD